MDRYITLKDLHIVKGLRITIIPSGTIGEYYFDITTSEEQYLFKANKYNMIAFPLRVVVNSPEYFRKDVGIRDCKI